ncbi:amidohydrolase family protein [Microbacteriaceae bacterium VKM Ac-2855]|nr:amidohydrolase family protein [Microbacteriaceae bacterium VKM Ac-2855]
MTIDAHVHVWNPAVAEYPWLTSGLAPLDRRIGLDEFDAEGIEVSGIVLVQASDNVSDTEVMRAQALRDPRVVAVVAWVPLDRPTEVAVMLEGYREDPLIVGVRNLVQLRPPGWLLEPRQSESLDLLQQAGLTLDFVTEGPDALAEVVAIGDAHPDLRIVIDHLGKPPVGGTASERASWRSKLADSAGNPLVFAKLSGLVPPSAAPGPITESVRPFIDDALELLGAERLMFGSDWPLVDRAGGYARAHDAISACIVEPSQRTAVFSQTARTFYNIQEPPL